MLAARQVVILLAQPDTLDDPARRDAALSSLTVDERAWLDRFRFPRDRDVALASRALQRRALSSCVDGAIAPEAWRFVPDCHGRPQIAAPALDLVLSWNVANTIGLVACAVTIERAIGIDVEPQRLDAPAEVVGLFATAEQRALRALVAAEQPRRFVELWTLKEAYLKARSLGLALPLERFAFDPSTVPPGLSIDAELADVPARWQVVQWWPTPGHCAAVCVGRDLGPPCELDVRWERELSGTGDRSTP